MSFVEIASSIEQRLRRGLALPTGFFPRLAARAREALLSREGLALVGMVATGAIFRLVLLGSKSLWLDEAFGVAITQRGLIELLRKVVRADTHPPLYYIVLKAW